MRNPDHWPVDTYVVKSIDPYEDGGFGVSTTDSSGFMVTGEEAKAVGVLPERVQEWSGLYANEGEPGFRKRVKVGEKRFSSLASANDNGRTFEEIADAIEGDSVGL